MNPQQVKSEPGRGHRSDGGALDVLQIITTIDVGGAETHLLSLCRGLIAGGHRVDVIYLKGQGTLEPAFAALGIKPQKVPLEQVAQLPTCVAGLYRHLKSRHYDVVHTHLLKANFTGAIASRLAGNRRIVASKHNDEPQLLNPVIGWLHRYSSRFDRRVICISEHILAHTVRYGGVERSKCQVIYYGVEDPPASDEDRELDAELDLGDAAVIACVARLVPRKGHVHLLAALATVLEKRRDVRLLIVGDGPARPALERLCRKRGLSPHVRFLGTRLDVPRILRHSTLLVLPSEAEGLGRVILEAMAAGKPVVASRVGGIPEMVVHGETGFLVAPGDANELAERLLELLADRDRAAALGRAGRRRMEQHFSLASMVEQTVAIYRNAAWSAG